VSIKSFHTFAQEVFESTLLSEIGDASSKPYRLKYDWLMLDYRRSTFVVKNEDFDADDPDRSWNEIEMFIDTYERTELLRGEGVTTILEISFGRYDRNEDYNTLDIGLKYLFRIMSTVVTHVSKHVEDYNKANNDRPIEGLGFHSSNKKGGTRSVRAEKQRNKLYIAYIEKNIRKLYPLAKVYKGGGYDVIVIFNPK